MATLKEDALIVAGIGLGVVVIAWYLKQKATEMVTAIPDAISNAWDAATVNGERWLIENIRNPVSDYVHKAEPMNDGSGRLINYTPEQQARDEAAMRQLERGYHGM